MLRTAFQPSTTPATFLETLLPQLHEAYGHHFTSVVTAPVKAVVELTGTVDNRWAVEVHGESIEVARTAAVPSDWNVHARIDAEAWSRGKTHLAEFREDLEDLLEQEAWKPKTLVDVTVLDELLAFPMVIDLTVSGAPSGAYGARILWGQGSDPIALQVEVDVRVVEDFLCQSLDPADLRRPDRVRIRGDIGRLTALGTVLSRVQGKGGR